MAIQREAKRRARERELVCVTSAERKADSWVRAHHPNSTAQERRSLRRAYAAGMRAEKRARASERRSHDRMVALRGMVVSTIIDQIATRPVTYAYTASRHEPSGIGLWGPQASLEDLADEVLKFPGGAGRNADRD